MTWDELEQLTMTNILLIETNLAALLEQSKEDQMEAIALGELLDVPIKPDEIFRLAWKPWILPVCNYQSPPSYRKMMKPSSVLRLFIALVHDDSRARMYDEVQDEIIPC